MKLTMCSLRLNMHKVFYPPHLNLQVTQVLGNLLTPQLKHFLHTFLQESHQFLLLEVVFVRTSEDQQMKGNQ